MQISQSAKQSKPSGVITGAILASFLFALAATPTYGASTTVHTATAYGAKVEVDGVATVGPVAVAELSNCSTAPTETFNASALSVNTGLLTTGAIASSAASTADSAMASSEVAGVSLLGGVITANTIEAVSTSSVSGDVFSSSAAGSTFADLKVLGIPIAANVAPNTVINLPGVGSVTLNEQTLSQSSDKSELKVVMIHVYIKLGANAGTEIVVADALSEIKTQSVPAAVGGYAYAPELVVGPVTSGPLVLETIPCFGTYGVVDTDSVASADIPGVVTTGVVKVTGTADLKASETSVETTTAIAGLNVLSGLVTATAITGEASGTTTDGVTFDFTGGSTFVGLAVAGFPAINDSVPPNTKIKIANLGDLYFNRVEIESDKIKVTPIELIVNATNTLGLPIGAELTLGVCEAALHSTDVP